MRSLGRVDRHGDCAAGAGHCPAARYEHTATAALSWLFGPSGGQDHMALLVRGPGEGLARVSDEMSDNGSERELPLAAVYGRRGRLKLQR
jgi:hypothetical protein